MKKIYIVCKKLFLAIACFIFIQTLHAQQAPAIQADKTIGGNSDDISPKVFQTKDGGYVICGVSESEISGDKTVSIIRKSYYDIWVIRCDNTGKITWQLDVGSKDDDWMFDCKLTPDEGLILVVTSRAGIGGNKTEASRGREDYWIVKINHKGKIEWDRTYGGSNTDNVTTVAVAGDGGYFVGGYSFSNKSGDKTEDKLGKTDYWILKLDQNGNLEWQKDYGGKMGNSDIKSIVSTSDGCIILGTTDLGIVGDKTCPNYGGYDYWLIRLDNQGKEIWQKDFGGSSTDVSEYISAGYNNTFFVAGESYSGISGIKTETVYGDRDCWVICIDINGNLLWQKDAGGSAAEFLYSCEPTKDGGCIIGSTSFSPQSGVKSENNHGDINKDADNWIVKLDKNGNIQWDKTIGGTNYEFNCSIKQTLNGGYIMCSSSESGISGDKTDTSRGSDDFWLVKLYPETPIISANKNSPFESSAFSNIKIFPNPAKDFLNIEGLDAKKKYVLSITDMQGNILYTTNAQSSKYLLSLPVLAKGIYYLKISDGKNETVKQFLKE